MEVIPNAIDAGIQVLLKQTAEKDNQTSDGEEDAPTLGQRAVASVALRTATAVVAVMEDNGHFNAGYGSMPNEDCIVEMDAAVMDGKDRSYGAVAALGYLLFKLFLHKVQENSLMVYVQDL